MSVMSAFRVYETRISDEEVLDITEDLHDRIDAVHGKPIVERATLAGELQFLLENLVKRGLTSDQLDEVIGVRYRLYVECLSVPEKAAVKLAGRQKDQVAR